ncbi:MAG: histidine--tRNA ligase [Candidatus Levyibacteriota bacterium]
MIEPKILKGFRDFLPKVAKKRQFVINALKEVFQLYGFEPLETPALEYEEVLLGKYGEEGDKLMYRFTDNGKRKVALRYDQTVPLARVVAQYQSELPIPFKRYQIQPVWRAENTQKGRFREFLQCDIDTVGSSSSLSDAEIISCTLDSLKKLGFKKSQIWVNDRTIFDTLGLKKEEVIILDKLDKIGKEEVIAQWEKNGRKNAKELFDSLKNSEPTQKLNEIFLILQKQGYKSGEDFVFVPYLARGLDYYTSIIFESKILDQTSISLLSLAGGGRYDNLIGMFSGKKVPAVGVSFGFDRIIEAMDELKLFPDDLLTTNILITVFSPDLLEQSIKIVSELRSENINTELWLDPEIKLDKQLKYADQKEIPFAIIIGPDEAAKNVITLRNMKTRDQKEISQEELINVLARSL